MPRQAKKPRWTRKKTVAAAIPQKKKRATATKSGVSPASRIGAAGRVKGKRKFKDPVQLNIEDEKQARAAWTTVELKRLTQACRFQSMVEEARSHWSVEITSYTRNLWIHSSIQEEARKGAMVRRDDVLGAQSRRVGEEFASGGDLRCLAIDVTLLTEGWLAGSATRPERVILLRDEYPQRRFDFSWCARLFERTTHVAIEYLWHQVRPRLPARGLHAIFPKMQWCCIQLDAAASAEESISEVEKLLSLHHLKRLVVCISSVYMDGPHLSPVVTALRMLAQTQEKLVVSPNVLNLRSEWAAMIAGKGGIFDRTHDEQLWENIPVVEPRKTDWQAGFLGEWQERNLEAAEALVALRTGPVEEGGVEDHTLTEVARDRFDAYSLSGVETLSGIFVR